MRSSRRTWRIRGVPREFDKDSLARALRYHSNLQWAGEYKAENVDTGGNDVRVHTLAPDLRGDEQVATVRFDNLPSQLSDLGARGQLSISINIDAVNRPVGHQCERATIRSVEVSIDEHFDGITTLISPVTDENHHIDILAVSGLGSHPFGSFVHKEDGNMWLTNNLPRDIPTARVMIFGYESRLQDSTSLVQLEDLASPLQDAVSRLLRSDRGKPLLLIGHSLGGLLAKQVLIRVAESRSDFASELPSLRDMILGLLLFGTPNDGLDVESLVPMVNDQPNRSLLESLKPNSPVLKRQRQEFSMVLERTKFQLICFYETELSPTAAKDPTTGQYKMSGPRRCLVSEPSATRCLPDGVSSTHSIAIRRTHSDLVKFSTYDAEYDRVAYVLERIQRREYQYSQVRWNSQYKNPSHELEEILVDKPAKRSAEETLPSPIGKRPRIASNLSKNNNLQAGGNHAPRDPFLHDEMKHLKEALVQQLYFSKIDERLTHLIPAQGTTCRWFLNEPKYKSWQDMDQQSDHGGFLWIKGNPGTGKSTLMKHLFEAAKLNAKGDTLRLTLSFFFLARGTVEEKTTTGLYRSLLHQLFQMAPDLQDSLEWLTADGARTIQGNGWSEEALQQTLKHAVPKLRNRSLTMFVDALDECDENKAGEMVSFFEDLCDCAAETRVRVQVCFSSRYYPTVVVEKGIEVSLEDEKGHTEDIKKYVKSRLKLKSKHAEALRSEILEKSSGIFLWVVLVLDILNNDTSVSILKKRERLKEIPAKLNDLFRMMVARDGENLEQLHLCLQWVLFASRALKPQELYFAIQFGFDKECSGFWDQADLDLDDMKTFVRSSSKGLAEVTRNKASEVQFIHESVRDFLLGKYGGQWSGASENFRSCAHQVLRDCCLVQVNASISQYAEIPDSLPQNPKEARQLREDISLKFPFLEYSVHNVLHHSNLSQRNRLEQEQFLADFPLQQWILLNNALEQYNIRRYTKSVSLLYILAERNLADLIQNHSGRKSGFHVEDERYGAPALAALANRSHEAVRAFLRAQAEGESPMSPLHGFCKRYEQDENRPTAFSREFTFKRSKSVLHNLLRLDTETMALVFLLSSQGPAESVDCRDGEHQTPLCLAAAKGYKAVVELLLEKGADIESKDTQSRTPLSRAAGNGHEALTRLLLEKGADIESKDSRSRTPLSHAAGNGHEALTRLLLEKGADIESKDSRSRTPLSHAAGNGHEALTRLLFEKGVAIGSNANHHGSPLSYAAGKGREAVVKLLLEKGVDIESEDYFNGTPLLSAVENGHEAIVRLLLEKGANVETRDITTRTPLTYAVAHERENLVKLLLENGADTVLKYKRTYEPGEVRAARPSMKSRKKIFRLLVEKGADIEEGDTNGRMVSLREVHNESDDHVELWLEYDADIELMDSDGQP